MTDFSTTTYDYSLLLVGSWLVIITIVTAVISSTRQIVCATLLKEGRGGGGGMERERWVEKERGRRAWIGSEGEREKEGLNTKTRAPIGAWKCKLLHF